MQLSRRELRREWACDKRRERSHLLAALAAMFAVVLLCQCFRYNAHEYAQWFVPGAYFKSLWLALRLLISRLAKTGLYGQADQLIDGIGSVLYYGSLARLKITLISLTAGAALCISGAVFQTAYQNPMASPNIIGASAGVNLGNVLVVLLYSVQAYEHIFLRYKFCYGFTVICVGLVLLLGRLAGDKRQNYSVMEMVMVGSIVSQAVNVFSMYVMYAKLDDDELVLYQEIRMGTYVDTSLESMIIFFMVMAVAILPVLLVRYRMNSVGMDRLETTALGINTAPLRLVCQICGALMVTCAMIHCGEIGMLSMVVPYIIRRIVGADFRKVCVFSAIAGAILLMICRLITSFVYLADEPIPVTFLMNVVLTPAFMVILAKQGRSRNET